MKTLNAVSVNYHIYLFLHKTNTPDKIKSAPTEVNAQKTQTPIVAKQIMQNRFTQPHIKGICVFIKFK